MYIFPISKNPALRADFYFKKSTYGNFGDFIWIALQQSSSFTGCFFPKCELSCTAFAKVRYESRFRDCLHTKTQIWNLKMIGGREGLHRAADAKLHAVSIVKSLISHTLWKNPGETRIFLESNSYVTNLDVHGLSISTQEDLRATLPCWCYLVKLIANLSNTILKIYEVWIVFALDQCSKGPSLNYVIRKSGILDPSHPKCNRPGPPPPRLNYVI